jgi:hypothetical protein
MSRLGNHRVNAAHSTANKARTRLDQLARQIEAAKDKNDDALVTKLQRERDYLILNSLS